MNQATAERTFADTQRPLIDTHCHLDDPVFDADRAAVLEASADAGVLGWVNIGFCPERWASTIELSQQTVGMLHALGMHPQHVREWSTRTKIELRSRLHSSRAIAVGEIGLDYYRGVQDQAVQRRVFAEQLDLSLELGMSVIIHQRSAEDDLVSILQELPHQHPVLLHSFDAGERVAGLARERGYFIGVGGLATRPRNIALRKILASFSLHQIVLESDAPYLVPQGLADRRNTPASVAHIAHFLAGLHNVSRDQVAASTTANALRFFGPDLLPNAGRTL